MRISDIIGTKVWHESGTGLGTAHEVRVVQRRPLGEHDALEVTGIVVGGGALGLRLGYGTPDQQGPWLLQQVFGRAAQRARYVPWSALRFEDGRIIVTAPIDSLRHPHAVEDES